MNSSFDVFSAVKNTSGISRAGNKCLSHYTWKEYFCPKVALLLSLSARFSLSTDFFEKNSVHVHINVVDNVGIGFFVGLSPATLESPGDSKEHRHATESMYRGTLRWERSKHQFKKVNTEKMSLKTLLLISSVVWLSPFAALETSHCTDVSEWGPVRFIVHCDVVCVSLNEVFVFVRWDVCLSKCCLCLSKCFFYIFSMFFVYHSIRWVSL